MPVGLGAMRVRTSVMFLNSPKKKPGENPVTRSGSEYKTLPIVSREGGESNRVREEVMEKSVFSGSVIFRYNPFPTLGSSRAADPGPPLRAARQRPASTHLAPEAMAQDSDIKTEPARPETLLGAWDETPVSAACRVSVCQDRLRIYGDPSISRPQNHASNNTAQHGRNHAL